MTHTHNSAGTAEIPSRKFTLQRKTRPTTRAATAQPEAIDRTTILTETERLYLGSPAAARDDDYSTNLVGNDHYHTSCSAANFNRQRDGSLVIARGRTVASYAYKKPAFL